MAATSSRPHNANSDEDIPSTSLPLTSSTTSSLKHIPKSKQHNAFTALMSSPSSHPPSKRKRKSPPPSVPVTDPARNTTFLGRDGLGAYIASPESFPASRVIYHTPQYVLINDLFPKSSIHLLLLPRCPEKTLLHPFEAFEDPAFLAETRAEVAKVKILAAKELRRRFGKFSALEQRRVIEEEKEEEGGGNREKKEAALKAVDSHDEDGKVDSVPERASASSNPSPPPHKGRDWSLDLTTGVHAVPSMTHLHIHILSRDRHSACMKHRKHYNSFATGFMVPLEDFPLAEDDRRRWPGREGFLEEELRCWRCGRGFGRRFGVLKGHLDQEFEGWKRV